MDGRLMADLGRLWQVSGRLRLVEREFADASAVSGEDDAFLGSVELASALQACVTGWSAERSALSSRLSHVARLSALAASSYEKTDAQLAAVLDKAMRNGTTGLAVSRPADWTPLATADPVPGDPVEVALLGRRLRQVADQISADVSWLRSLCTAQFWDSGAGAAFQGQVDAAAAKLARARERYQAAGEALGSGLRGHGYAAALAAAQSLSLRALAQARRAWSAMLAQLAAVEVANRGPAPYAGPPSLTLFPGLPRLDSSGNPVPMAMPEGADPQLSAAVRAYNASALEYRTANGWLAEAIVAREEAAARAAAQIRDAIGADGLQDRGGRWHDVTGAGWGKEQAQA